MVSSLGALSTGAALTTVSISCFSMVGNGSDLEYFMLTISVRSARGGIGKKADGTEQLCPPSSQQLDHHSSAGASCPVHRPPRGLWPIWLAATILAAHPRWLVGHGVGGPDARPWLLSASFGSVLPCIVANRSNYAFWCITSASFELS
jgi:hypothetical protein